MLKMKTMTFDYLACKYCSRIRAPLRRQCSTVCVWRQCRHTGGH